MNRPMLSVNDHAHAYNRGVDKRIVFNNRADYARFIHILYLCNDPEYVASNIKRIVNVQSPTLNIYERSGERLVDILCFCLMPNHYHLLLKQNVEGGISKFMQRVGTAYTNFFNLKNDRRGSLFASKYKYKIITKEEDLAYLSKYIHLNPVKIIEPKWQSEGISDWKRVNEYLEGYKWSSYKDYIGIKNFPSVINKGLLEDFAFNQKEYKKFINSYLVEDLENLEVLF